MNDTYPSKRVKNTSIEALPSAEEQRQLQQLEILMKNNLLNLQVKELISEVNDSEKMSSKKMTSFVQTLESDLKDRAKYTCHKRMVNVDWCKTQFPVLAHIFPDDATSDKDQVFIEYESPSTVEVTGSHSHQTMIAPFYNIDILLPMPTSIIQPKDVVNNVYFQKRALFLAAVRKSLEKINVKQGERYQNFQFVLFKDDDHKVILTLQPLFSDAVTIRLIPTLNESCIKLVNLRPSKNNVRPLSWMQELKARRQRGINVSLDANVMDTSQLSPTPHYNNAILEDVALNMHHQVLQRAVSPFESARHGLILLKIWLRQHELMSACDGFDSHLLALFIAYLVQSKRISTSFTAEAVFQAAISFLLTLDVNSPFIMDFTSSSLIPAEGEEKSSYEKSFPLVLQHPLGGAGTGTLNYNCFWRVSASYFERFQRAATLAKSRLSMNQQQVGLTGVFESLFLQHHGGVVGGYDLCFHIPLLATAITTAADLCLHTTDDQEGGGESEGELKEIQASLLHIPQAIVIANRIKKLLSRALGDRVSVIDTHLIQEGEQKVVFVGINFNRDLQVTLRKVDRGPVHNTNAIETRNFKRFWGEKSSLRRFKDGSIVEAVVWEDADLEQELTSKRQQLIMIITKYILTRHLPYLREKDDLLLSSFGDWSPHTLIFPLPEGENNNIMQVEEQVEVDEKVYEQSLTSVQALQKAWDELRSLFLTKLPHDTLPLRIEGVATHTPLLRQTSLAVATPQLILQLQNNPNTQNFPSQTQNTQNVLRSHHGEQISTITQTLDVWVRLESATGRWPAGKQATEACKTAMLIRLQQVLKKHFHMKSVLNQDSTSPLANNFDSEVDGAIPCHHLDLPLHGYIFRLRLFAGPETEKLSVDSRLSTRFIPFASLGYSPAALAVNTHHTAPMLHHQEIKAFSSLHPIAYPDTVRLLTLWLSKHGLSGQVKHEAVEVLSAVCFLEAGQGATGVGSGSVGLYHTLRLLAEFPFEEEPLIVDFSTAISSSLDADLQPSEATAASASKSVIDHAARNTILTAYRAIKAAAKASQADEEGGGSGKSGGGKAGHRKVSVKCPSIYLVTSTDRLSAFRAPWLTLTSSTASEEIFMVEPVILNLIKQSAKKSLTYLQSSLLQDALTQQSLLFARPSAIMKKCHAVFTFAAGLHKQTQCSRFILYANTSMQNLNPEKLYLCTSETENLHFPYPIQAKIIAKLRQQFHAFALFFWDESVGDKVGVLLRPSFLENREFAVLESEFRMPVKDSEGKAMLKANVSELLQQMLIVGEGYLALSSLM